MNSMRDKIVAVVGWTAKRVIDKKVTPTLKTEVRLSVTQIPAWFQVKESIFGNLDLLQRLAKIKAEIW